VIFPMAPIGVMSVSPVARAATIDRRKVRSTATTPIHHVIPKRISPRTTQAVPKTSVPVANHQPGTSTRASGSSVASARRPTRVARPPKARTTVRHLSAKDRRPDVTIIAVAGQSTHETMPR